MGGGEGGRCRTAKEFVCGCRIVDCDSRERAIGLAAPIPDVGHAAMQVRPLADRGGAAA